ncbi:MAG: methyltransferase domain-containing protein, partial [Planctomycetota bacterium]
IELGRRPIFARMMLTDASEPMLARAKKNVYTAGLQGGIRLREARADDLPFDDGEFHAVICNSLMHHLEKPVEAFREAARVLRSDGLLFFRDLVRPRDAAAVDAMVAEHAADEEPAARTMFRDSLHASYTPEELAGLLDEAGVRNVTVERTGDRHVTLAGCPNRADGGGTSADSDGRRGAAGSSDRSR